MERSHAAGSRLRTTMLAYMLGIVLVVTLVPFRFSLPGHLRISTTAGLDDLVANVLLFVPLGFLSRLFRSAGDDPHGIRVLGWGMLLSGAVEAAQLFTEDRYPSLVDVVANGGGAWAGAVLHDRLSRRLRADHVTRRLSLELPLMGVLYLLLPLLWLTSLTAVGAPSRVFLLVFLGLFGGSLLASVQRHHFGPAGALSARGTALIAAVWLGLGAAPVLAGWPTWRALLFLLAAAGFVLWRAGAGRGADADRRFEARALGDALPYFGAYLGLLPALPLLEGAGAWSFSLAFPDQRASYTLAENIRLLEGLAAYTIFGYLLAELRGRRELPYRTDARWILCWSALAAGISETLLGFATGASVARYALGVAVSLYGGWIYHQQRAYVRLLVAERAGVRPRAPEGAGPVAGEARPAGAVGTG